MTQPVPAANGRVDVYFDVICPWCYIGHRRVRTALAAMPDDRRPLVVWRAFELGPDLGRVPGTTAAEQMAAESWWGPDATARIAHIRGVGAAEGLRLNLHLARPVNSFDAHRLVKLAAARGRVDHVLEAVMRGYHTDGLNIADHAVLERIGAASGLDRDDIRAMLNGDTFAVDVRADERLAQRMGVVSVPSLVVGGRPPVSGVLAADALRRILSTATSVSAP
ncbi:DsbA family oxidoreductase [Thermasporomyces composti]|jgi:predicted DsbA family dithiol-disulfide isomerase|uniref:Putative DsbA family dithiol-disulfide isomerase n=1 Tax=Thermasporomyces composti TaxID=696763 RepID=A0A3D9V2K0_THECX|nr:DsbA family oxidoreductase [Thermasporomyces composti]REF35757.1 putative DsbA family dithiol-disulfide isomerase [Thermasporomyces composti]